MLKHLAPWINAAVLLAAALVVWWAGARLAQHADEFARKTGIGSALIGLLLLGGMTSLPELAVAVTATLADAPLLTVNDILGSAAINVLLLALADAAYRRGPLTSTPSHPEVLLQGTLSVLLLVLVAASVLTGDTLLFGVGAWSWLLLASYGVSIWMVSQAKTMRSWVPDPRGPRHEQLSQSDEPATSPRRLVLRIVGVGVLILGAGFLLAQSAEAIAEQSGLGTSFVGAVLLALCTSLPEVSTVLAAVRLSRFEMALADVLGTNLFNVVIIVLVDALHGGGPVLPAAGRFAAFAALLAAVMTLLFLVGTIERRDRMVWRMGVTSWAVLAVYLAGVVMLYRLR